MHIDQSLQQLAAFYAAYEQFIEPFPMACAEGCDSCCTCNVWLTTLEGLLVIKNLQPDAMRQVIQQIDAQRVRPCFRPQLTTNEIASRCVRGQPIPEESIEPAWGSCPALADRLCSLYAARPFGCRCMVSRSRCDADGQAEMDSLIISANTLLLQVIEHLDAGGYSGNFADVLACLYHGRIGNPSDIAPGHISAYHLIANRPIPVLMIPPEHRRQLQPLVERLQGILTT
jgi:hypothetical protein